ncbi:hypothetical protein MTO96_043880 [Rhipicephalus appendiculatus]
MGSRPPEFDETASSWDAYRVRLEANFEGNDITDSSKRRALLVASLSDSVDRVIQGRCPLRPVNSLTYEEVEKMLEEHYSPQNNVDQVRTRPMERNLVWSGRTLRRLIDTGSSVSVIPKNVFRKNPGEVSAEVEPTREQPSPAKTPPLFPPGKPIWSRQFQQGQKWLPGTVIATEGNRMVKVETILGTQRRHVDQLRARLASNTLEKTASRIGSSSAETQQEADAREASATPNSSPATPQSPGSTQGTLAPEAVPTPLFNANKTPSGTTGLLKREEVQRRR